VAEIGYWVAPPARGRGRAAAGTRLLARYAFQTLRPRRVEVLVQTGNVASRRAAERAGTTYEGIRRAGIEMHGEPVDAAVYAFLPDDPAVAEEA
jgi:RimJ/RimL family protein N-acetyltransferase